MVTQNLLVELFVEELPPKALKKLGEAFSNTLFESLNSEGLTSSGSIVTSFATPRRLAAHISQVAAQAADKNISQKLMPVSVGLDASGNATPALIKRLQGLGLDESAVTKLTKQPDGKNEALFIELTQTGANLKDGLQKAIDETLAKLPIPKVMTYQLTDGWSNVNFVRPAHGLVALHGAEIVPVTALGLTASNTTGGHRFEAKNSVITLKNADTYAEQLKTEGAVIASYDERRAEIVRQLNAAAAKENLKPIEDEALLDEVNSLVELPNVLLGQFEKEFLEVPQECLILTMKANQKYFPLLDASGKLTNKFLIISNIKPADASKVIGGNERVVRPRLADAKFFFDQDRKKTLESRIEGLNKVVYHNKLGSQGERNARVVAIAKAIAQQLGDANLESKVEFAAKLSKADLLTDMVGEFPELQGIMGRYYAQHEGWEDDVAFAIEDHYKPRFAGDELPRNQVGLVVALADKLETLVGLFSIGEKPTGDKDPFGLRRQALGVTRILDHTAKLTDIRLLLSNTQNLFNFKSDESVINGIIDFFYDRLRSYYRELQITTPDGMPINAYTLNEIDAVLENKPTDFYSFRSQLIAVGAFSRMEESTSLAAANKRIGNILKKSEGKIDYNVNVSLFLEPAERNLHKALSEIKPRADRLFELGDYTASLQALSALKAPVDDFFDNVMVNVDDVALKNNRLALLNQLHQTMNRVADLSKLAN